MKKKQCSHLYKDQTSHYDSSNIQLFQVTTYLASKVQKKIMIFLFILVS